MNPTHVDVLADLHGQVAASHVPPGEVDQRVAEALGVAPGDYATYFAVAAAIKDRARQAGVQARLPLDPPGGGPLAQAWTLAETIAAAAAGICLQAAGHGQQDIYTAAIRIHQACQRLARVLSELERHPDRVAAIDQAALTGAAAITAIGGVEGGGR